MNEARKKWRVGPRCTYDVFLSFRGEDTRKNFTDKLYNALVDAGFRTFRDDNEIERGEDIKSELDKAIHQSRSSIIVLSENYASSGWCLDELVMIVDNKRNKGHTILPVFYNVEPWQVSKQMGSFADAFARHEERFDSDSGQSHVQWVDRVKGWRAALSEVADIDGMALRKDSEKHEFKFIQKVTKVIEDKVNRSILSVAPYLIGIDSRVRGISFWLQDPTAINDILGICGAGGIGKTTIAKYVFNLNYEKFEASCFMENVRDIAEHQSGLVQLQKQFLYEILKGRKQDFQTVDEGIQRIKGAVFDKRVLVVLDDIDQANQLDSVLGMQDWVSPGSKIIITTRYSKVLEERHIFNVHNVEKLDEDESSELFSWHAFGKEYPDQDYLKLFKKMVEHCGGLPLALRVVGSSLSGKSLEVWESTLKKLEAIPNSQVDKKLKLSYDSLQDEHDKSLFLDVACFFVGNNKEYVATILDQCGMFTNVGIQNLVDRCLLAIARDNSTLSMHHLIRDMGREVIRQESPKYPGRRSRLWHYKDSLRVLNERSGSDAIQGFCVSEKKHKFLKRNEDNEDGIEIYHKIRLSHKEAGASIPNEPSWEFKKLDIATDAFSRMDRLRLLRLENVRLYGSYKKFPNMLRWLSWHEYPHKYVGNDIPLENLAVLEMRYSSLECCWKETRVLGHLKILDLSYSSRLSDTRDISGFPNLEKLILKYCTSLRYIDQSVGELTKLVLLNLDGCNNLRKLPQSICNIPFLEKLILSGCSKLDLFSVELGKIKGLVDLNLDGISIRENPFSNYRTNKPNPTVCWSLMTKPRKALKSISLSRAIFSSLANLSLVNCNLSSCGLPEDLTSLSSLQRLFLSRNPMQSLPGSMKHLTMLKSLELEHCDNLEVLPELPESITTLSIYRCGSLQKLLNLPNLLTSLNLLLLYCNNLYEVEGLFILKAIGDFGPDVARTLGLANVDLLTHVEVDLYNSLPLARMRLPVQGLYEFGIFSTSVPSSKVPNWFNYKTTGSLICFQVPAFPALKILGINVCVTYEYLGKGFSEERNNFWDEFHVRVANKTKNLKWTYSPTFNGLPRRGEDVTWLSHWKIGHTLDPGDALSISMTIFSGYRLKEFGVHVVYEELENRSASTVCSSTLHSIDGVDISSSAVAQGCYFLCLHDFDVHQSLNSGNGRESKKWHEYLFGDCAGSSDNASDEWRVEGSYGSIDGSKSETNDVGSSGTDESMN